MSETQQIAFVANEELLTVLSSLGISRNAATRALYNTGNYNADIAAAWIFENQHHNLDLPITQESLAAESSGEEDEGDKFAAGGCQDLFKMVLVVNMALEMGVGKVSAQVGHGAVGLYRQLMEKQEQYGEQLLYWDDYGAKKIVLKGNNDSHLLELEQKATSLRLPSYSVFDAGKTQIAAGSFTVLAIMGRNEEVDKVTGPLSLL